MIVVNVEPSSVTFAVLNGRHVPALNGMRSAYSTAQSKLLGVRPSLLTMQLSDFGDKPTASIQLIDESGRQAIARIVTSFYPAS